MPNYMSIKLPAIKKINFINRLEIIKNKYDL